MTGRRSRLRAERRGHAGRGDAWEREEFVTAGAIPLPCMDAAISLEAIYAGVEFPRGLCA